ncbi:MAG: CbtA family protein, partial [Pseudomonadota bacterium]
FQHLFVTPIILEAEAYEVAEPEGEEAQATDSHDGHTHSHEGWGPEDGAERTFYSMLSNVLISFSFALLLISAMALHNHKASKPPVNAVRGLAWGFAAMLAMFVAPALLGLHPEVPGTVAAHLEHRQVWWIFCGIATAVGLAVLYYAPALYKLAGIALIAIPHLVGAPHPSELSFANTDPDAVTALTALTEQFYTMTAVGMLLFFLLLGAASGFSTRRFVRFETA